jgi:hypothetical protein
LLPSSATCSSPSSTTLFLTLPPKLYSVFLVVWVYFVDLIFVCIFCWVLFTWAGGKRGNILIWIDWFALNWDCGLVNCGTNILCWCRLSW